MKIIYINLILLLIIFILLIFSFKCNNKYFNYTINNKKGHKRKINIKYLDEYNEILKIKKNITNNELIELKKCYKRTKNIVCDRKKFPFKRGYDTNEKLTYEVINFNYSNNFIIKPEKCKSQYIVAFMTRPNEYYERDVQRKLYNNDRKFSVYFIMMKSKEEKYNKMIEIENNRYNDIVQFLESASYFNMTVQALRLLEWVNQYCTYKLLIKSDVDVFINYRKISKFLDKIDENKKEAYGGIITGRILRSSKYLHRLSYATLPGTDYPPYFIGLGSIITNRSVKEMLKNKDLVKKIWIDDAYFGLLMKKSGIHIITILNRTREKFINVSISASHIKELYFIHGLKSSEKFYLNSKLKKMNNKL